MTRNELLPAELLARLPMLGTTADKRNPLAHVKFFYPDFDWTWYGIEFDGEDLFFGLVDGYEKELGYFRLSELLDNCGKWGLEIERDLSFSPTEVSELMRSA